MKWTLRIKMVRISTIAIISCLILLVSFAGYTVYGTQVGNWVVNIEDPSIQLILSTNEDYDTYGTTRLTVTGLKQQDNATYQDVPSDITSGLGSKNDTRRNRYLAFSFLLVNKSEQAVDYQINFDILATKGGGLSAARFLIIQGDGDKSTGVIYAMPESSVEAEDHLRNDLANYEPYETVPIASDSVVFTQQVSDMPPNDPVKYTVVLWYEGCDYDCTDDIIGSTLRLELSFVGY